MKAAPVFEAGNHRWWVLYDQDERRVIDSNVYIVESNGQSAILDPGGFEIFPQVLAAVAEVVPPTSVVKAFVSHQDPDIASSLPLWNACNQKVQWHIPSLWEGFIRHYGALDAELIGIPDEGGVMVIGGHKLELIPAHYLHASANFHVYDPEAKVYFSGDVGAALLPPGHSIWVGGHQGAESTESIRRPYSACEVFPSAMDALKRRQKGLDRPCSPVGHRLPLSSARSHLCRRKRGDVFWTGSTA